MRQYGDCADILVDINRVAKFILSMHLDIFSWLEESNLFLVDHISKENFPGTFVSDSPAPGVDDGNALIPKTEEATRFTIISLDIRFNRMVAWADLTCSLTVQTKC